MTEKRFVASVDESCIVDNLENKGLYSVPDTVECLNNLHEENVFLKEQRHKDIKDFEELLEEKESWKSQCVSASNQNQILWNEISIMREQGAKPSDAFENYLEEISSDYDNFWRRKLKKAKEGVWER